MSQHNSQLTAVTRARYDRIAPVYDLVEALMERAAFRSWRARAWAQVSGGRVLEVGVGTGKNMPYYPPEAQVIAVDLSDRMLQRARRRAARLGQPVDLRLMDAQALDFPDGAFDAVVATFVFCSVPDPMLGLQELGRVCKPDGRIVLLEHVRSEGRLMGWLMDLFNPLVVRLIGANINRRTVENVQRAGLHLDTVENLSGIVKLIVAHRGSGR
jgi:ubiquinone/menaquinone biosynthesis C-methylase UbiE